MRHHPLPQQCTLWDFTRVINQILSFSLTPSDFEGSLISMLRFFFYQYFFKDVFSEHCSPLFVIVLVVEYCASLNVKDHFIMLIEVKKSKGICVTVVKNA